MNIALILSGGSGTRLGSDIPKQYIDVGGKPIIAYSIETFAACKCIDAFVIAAADEWHDLIAGYLPKDKFCAFSEPGITRQLSIYNGLIVMKSIIKDDDIVIIHDAARPLVSETIINKCVETALLHDGALPVLPMKDTVYYSENRMSIASLLKREKVFAGQAPEAFKYGKYLKANEDLMPEGIMQINGSSEPAVIAGMQMAMINGDEKNFKITTKEDLVRFEQIMGNIL